ncbi:MAG TPA: DUF1028 domain-containing protein [Vicinamibacterales bacterium]|nr:DUF1028 domain-containing protein [Vicinamibacterales bacterium]
MTYSIAARDRRTGELGVAVQSHYFSVGPVVPWVEAGVGAVATQAMVEISYGPRGLGLMRAGATAADALRTLVAQDKRAGLRQVAMVSAAGDVAAHTGERCIAHAGHRTGDGVSVQANMMERPTVPDAMLAAYEAGSGDLASRLLAALDAAEAEGGDIRGRQSAAMIVVRGEGTGEPWRDRLFDLRVEDHAEPLAELRRLVDVARAYRLQDEAESAAAAGDMATAAAKVQQALALSPGNPEIAFWAAVASASSGQYEIARPLLALATRAEPRWRELLRRLPATGLFGLTEEAAQVLLAEPGGAR